MYLNFNNEKNKNIALKTKRVNYENNVTEYDAFIVLLKDVDYSIIDTLCIEVARRIEEELNLSTKIDPRIVHATIQSKSLSPSFKKTVLDVAYNIIHEGRRLGTKIDGKHNASNWIIHCLYEGEAMSKLAESMNLDTHTAMKLGLLHDIGRKEDQSFLHTVKGFEYLIEQGLEVEAFCSLTHSFLSVPKDGVNKGNRGANCDPSPEGFYINPNGEGVFKEGTSIDDVTKFLEQYEYNEYDIILNIADLMATSKGIESPYDRMINVYSRRTPDINSPFFKVCFINSLNRLLYTINKRTGYKPININDMTSVEEIDRILITVSDTFMDTYLNYIQKDQSNITKKG